MTAHDHSEFVDGCYRCALSRDEIFDRMVEICESMWRQLLFAYLMALLLASAVIYLEVTRG